VYLEAWLRLFFQIFFTQKYIKIIFQEDTCIRSWKKNGLGKKNREKKYGVGLSTQKLAWET